MRSPGRVIAALATGAVATVLGLGALGMHANAANDSITFNMVRSQAAVNANCPRQAKATVRVVTHGVNETMTLRARGLPRDTAFDLFIIQVPNAPFGVSWYQGDLQSGRKGQAAVTVIGRFNIETFAVAPGVAKAPVVHDGRDASENPAFNRSTPTTWGSGSTPRTTPRRRAAPTRSRRSTVTTPPASRP
jgi:hypothetical protein